jgi:hypothetical protein
MSSESEPCPAHPRPPADQRGTDAADLILAALDQLRGVHETSGSPPRPPTLACQKENLRQWADRLGLLLNNWFASLGFVKITDAAYYRAEDNLGVFDAHDKNLVRADEDVLVPFDVIPCHPAGGFLAFIEEAHTAGHTLRAIRAVTTHRQP